MLQRPKPKEWHCYRCGHDWNARKAGVPLRCGSCKSSYYARKPKEAVETAEYEVVK